jgi:exopolyphosphatase/guanosine-5'-triphosphate,3'-diphosphate pyrophosphatase
MAGSGIIGAADLGTNTIKVSIAEVGASGALRELVDGAETIRLGAGIERTGGIEPERIELCLGVLKAYEARGTALGATTFIGVATEALRIARNGSELLDRIGRETSWDIHIISGDEEARLTFLGLRDHLPATGRALIVDIGGGSTELVLTEGGEMIASESVPIGSGRLADRFFHADPPSPDALAAAAEDARAALAASDLLRDIEHVLLSGGNGVFLARLAEQLFPDDPINVALVERLLADFATVPAQVTADRLGIAHERARVLPAGAALALAALRLAQPRTIAGIPSGIRIGLIREWARLHG